MPNITFYASASDDRAIKEAARQIRFREGLSMSRWIARAMKAYLAKIERGNGGNSGKKL